MEGVGVDVDGYLVNVMLRTHTLVPDVHEFAACDKHKIQITNCFAAVTDGTNHTRCILHEVQLIHLMAVRRILKKGLDAFADIEDVKRLKTAYFIE